MANQNPADRERGLYDKFTVVRNDGRSSPGERHHGCEYFVLDLDHDPFARIALQAYAEACLPEFPALATDLFDKLRTKSFG